MLIAQNPEQVLANSQQHVYATPSRVQTPDHLLAEEQQAHMYNTRRSKSRTCTLPQAYSAMVSIDPIVIGFTLIFRRSTLANLASLFLYGNRITQATPPFTTKPSFRPGKLFTLRRI
jgi:hypothetical protein